MIQEEAKSKPDAPADIMTPRGHKMTGEYDVVCRKTSRYVLLKMSHSQITKAEDVRGLIFKLFKRHNVSNVNAKIHITAQVKYGKGGHRMKRGKRIPYVALPKGDVRTGLIIHEVAHAIVHMRKLKTNGEPHGGVFVEIFDRALTYYYNELYQIDDKTWKQ